MKHQKAVVEIQFGGGCKLSALLQKQSKKQSAFCKKGYRSALL